MTNKTLLLIFTLVFHIFSFSQELKDVVEDENIYMIIPKPLVKHSSKGEEISKEEKIEEIERFTKFYNKSIYSSDLDKRKLETGDEKYDILKEMITHKAKKKKINDYFNRNFTKKEIDELFRHISIENYKLTSDLENKRKLKYEELRFQCDQYINSFLNQVKILDSSYSKITNEKTDLSDKIDFVGSNGFYEIKSYNRIDKFPYYTNVILNKISFLKFNSDVKATNDINSQLRYSLYLEFTGKNIEKLKVFTEKNRGKPMAMVIANKIVLIAGISSTIKDGKMIISSPRSDNCNYDEVQKRVNLF